MKALPQITRAGLIKYLKEYTAEKPSLRFRKKGGSAKFVYEAELPVTSFAPLKTALFDKRFVYYDPYGEPLADSEILLSVRNEILSLAEDSGYPGRIDSARGFDQKLSELIWRKGQDLGLNLTTAGKAETWYYLQGVLLTDLVIWRWKSNDGEVNAERFFQQHRGFLSAPWWRYQVLTDNGKCEYEPIFDYLTQDDMVGIIERPKVRGYNPLIRKIATKIAVLRAGDDQEAKEKIRPAMVRLRSRCGIQNPWIMVQDAERTKTTIKELFK